MDQNNIYTKMQRDFYNSTADIMAIENHRGHDSNPDYYGLLLKEVFINPNLWKDKVALDFGCGIGRNVDNLLKIADWKSVDGCDISVENINRAEKFLQNTHDSNKFKLYTTTGTTLNPINDNLYDFVMSTIVLQHIAVHQIRNNLLTDIFRVMKSGGLFSFQMAQYSQGYGTAAKYHDNMWNASGTNGAQDVSVDNPQDLINDLLSIGYNNISYEVRPEWDAKNKCYLDLKNSRWLFIKAYKP
jgi:ubiquinone/menaquinone biosynthesis C-methylase UbiE